MEEDRSSTIPKRQLGRYLREGRDECGLTLEQAAKLIERSSSTLQRMEKGTLSKIVAVDLDALCALYDFNAAKTAAMKGLAAQANEDNWWHEYGHLIPEDFDIFVGLEAAAQSLITYESELVPGLLQIPAYASALMHAVFPDDSAEEHALRVQLRMRRQTRITRKVRPAKFDVVLRESVLRGLVGGPKVMGAQARYLADIGTRSNVSIQILPFRAGFPLGVAVGPFVILDFGEDKKGSPIEPPVVYRESYTGDLYLSKPAAVRRYHQAYECLRRNALDAVASRHLLRQVAKEYGA
ncbi:MULTISPECIES: helix-turn-helix transcriptional regulator [unclassified Nocardia]|uniref:helix-turn-helix domain-containing protein n=1 Tax=unclassified Nocardia TaxID=2637762 RepID=UPI001CE46603|nr:MULTISPECIES: helix-turn-helix transcriptional regulator [unclassified Nocardia]